MVLVHGLLELISCTMFLVYLLVVQRNCVVGVKTSADFFGEFNLFNRFVFLVTVFHFLFNISTQLTDFGPRLFLDLEKMK